MTTDDSGDRTEQVYEQLQYQTALFARRAERVRMGGVSDHNALDRAAYLLLNRLEREGPVGVKALAQAMGIDSSTVTRQVAPLVDSGLVDRLPNPKDGRAVLLALSVLGLERLNQVRVSRRALMRELLTDWSPEDREQFSSLLTRFNQAMREYNPSIGLEG
ncbi:MarR family transcriptional regulator [Streptacidiphilus sp. 4-A2]|nr:MarR family transcriptional regulator [Streptacidiphilus sp. 4-A2]